MGHFGSVMRRLFVCAQCNCTQTLLITCAVMNEGAPSISRDGFFFFVFRQVGVQVSEVQAEVSGVKILNERHTE